MKGNSEVCFCIRGGQNVRQRQESPGGQAQVLTSHNLGGSEDQQRKQVFCLSSAAELSHTEGQIFYDDNVNISEVLSGPAAQFSHHRLAAADHEKGLKCNRTELSF